MKILLIHTTYRFKGGEDSVVESESNLLKSHNHEIFPLFFENPTHPVKAILVFFCSIFNVSSYIKVIRAIKTFQPDIIHVHNWHFAASPAVFIAARRMKMPVVHTLHNYRLLCPSGILFTNGELFLDSVNRKFPWLAVRKRVYRNSLFQTFWLAFVVWFHKQIGTWREIDRFIALTPFSKRLFEQSSLHLDANKISVKPNFV